MSLDCVRDYCIQALCSRCGSLSYSTLRREVSRYFKVSDEELSKLLADGQLFTKVPAEVSGLPGPQLSGDSLIVATTPARLCSDFLKRKCSDGDCRQLHLCKFFLFDNCRFAKGRNSCNFPHDIHSRHNSAVLRAHKLHYLKEVELRQILLQNDSSLLPEICVFYNKGLGQYGSCTFKHSCTKLHVCLHFVQGTCKFGSNCKHSHNFKNSNNSSVLENLSLDLIMRLPQIYQNMYNIRTYSVYKDDASENNHRSGTAAVKEKRPQSRLSSSSSCGDMDNEEICLYFIWSNCSFKDRCIRVHFKLPYRWQVYEKAWKDLPNMEKIEKDYCDPNKARSENIDFNSMLCGSNQVRRLSTASSVTKPPNYILTTEWLWYWKDENREWIEYGKQEKQHSAANITPVELEKAFLADSNGKVEFTVGIHQYVLNFKEMQQTNSRIGTRREVKRRPKFISEQDMKSQIQNQRKTGQEILGISQGKSLPAHWDKSARTDIGYKLIQVAESSDEFKQVQSLFQRTMKKSVIQKIERIQNISLWEVYQWFANFITFLPGYNEGNYSFWGLKTG